MCSKNFKNIIKLLFSKHLQIIRCPYCGSFDIKNYKHYCENKKYVDEEKYIVNEIANMASCMDCGAYLNIVETWKNE